MQKQHRNIPTHFVDSKQGHELYLSSEWKVNTDSHLLSLLRKMRKVWLWVVHKVASLQHQPGK